MMTAQRWHEYQDSYKRYGLDMKPREPKPVKVMPKPGLSVRDKLRFFALLAFAGILCVGVIVSTAYAAKIKYEVNTMLRHNDELRGEIENLTVDIKTAANIETVEQKAISELGMICPGPDQVKYLLPQEKPEGDFALLLKEQAYN